MKLLCSPAGGQLKVKQMRRDTAEKISLGILISHTQHSIGLKSGNNCITLTNGDVEYEYVESGSARNNKEAQ